jgi:hypothetical protein
MFDQRSKTDLLHPHQPSRYVSIEYQPWHKSDTAAQHAEIVITPVKNDRSTLQEASQDLEIEGLKRIDQDVLTRRGKLNEAQLFKIAVKAISFRIYRDLGRTDH